MAKFTWDHIHLRTPDPEATAQWFEKMLGAEISRTMQQGAPRIDMKIGGANVFLAPVKAGDGVNAPPVTPYQGLDHFGLSVTRHRRHRGRPQGQGRRVHPRADHGAAGHARLLHPRPAGRVDRTARPHGLARHLINSQECRRKSDMSCQAVMSAFGTRRTRTRGSGCGCEAVPASTNELI